VQIQRFWLRQNDGIYAKYFRDTTLGRRPRSGCHYASGERLTAEIESEGTAARRLP
jgi:hypothetical protein